MKVNIITIGKEKNALGADALIEYSHRLVRTTDIQWVYIAPSASGGDRAKKEEGGKILSKIIEGDFVVCLDEHGKQMNTIDFASFLDKRIQGAVKRLVFVIGGAYGLDRSVLERASYKLSLSAFTFPHELVCIILAEQLYRAFSVLHGEKYHHD
jgi:23S rRNA (pseudouridine1915-N3)-methyltransferase